jgi:hypothetical protein
MKRKLNINWLDIALNTANTESKLKVKDSLYYSEMLDL